MEIPEKFKTEPSELKLFLERGSIRVYFEDGTFWEVENPEKEVVKVQKQENQIPDNFKHYLAEPMVNRLLYLLLLRPYNKLSLAVSYYKRKKNIARGHIDKALLKLKKLNLLRKVDWKPEFLEEYGLTNRSKHIYVARPDPLFFTMFSDESHMFPEHFFITNVLKSKVGHMSKKFFFEWDTDKIKEENVDVFKLIKIKIYELLLMVSCVKNKHNEIWHIHSKATITNFREIMKKLGILFQYIDPEPVLDYLVSVLVEELAEPILEDLKNSIERLYGSSDENLFKVAVILMFLPPLFLEELLSKMALL